MMRMIDDVSEQEAVVEHSAAPHLSRLPTSALNQAALKVLINNAKIIRNNLTSKSTIGNIVTA